MDILFPENPMMRKLPEPIFEPEFDAATSLGFRCLLFDDDAFRAGDVDRAFQRLPADGPNAVLYRGWIMTEERYRGFYAALAERGFTLVSSPEDYAAVNYFPNYFPKIREFSPAAIWTDAPDSLLAWTMSRKLGRGPFVVKDHIKSAKHNWLEASYIPEGADREYFEGVLANLRREQEPEFHRGFVVKQYVPLRRCGRSPYEYPLCEEYRLFFWHRKLLVASHYHRQPAIRTDWTEFLSVADRFSAPFFTMDIAESEAGAWIIVDMGAGEVSSLPPSLDPLEFYRQLATASADASSVNRRCET